MANTTVVTVDMATKNRVRLFIRERTKIEMGPFNRCSVRQFSDIGNEATLTMVLRQAKIIRSYSHLLPAE